MGSTLSLQSKHLTLASLDSEAYASLAIVPHRMRTVPYLYEYMNEFRNFAAKKLKTGP